MTQIKSDSDIIKIWGGFFTVKEKDENGFDTAENVHPLKFRPKELLFYYEL